MTITLLIFIIIIGEINAVIVCVINIIHVIVAVIITIAFIPEVI